MHSLQRPLGGSGGFATLAASNATPLNDPRLNVSRGAQSRSMRRDAKARKGDGKKNEHLWVHGNLPQKELLNIMSGGIDNSRLLQDWGDDVTLFRDNQGGMQGFDEETGRPLVMIGYDFATLKDPTLTPKQGRYAKENRAYREDVDDYDWRAKLGTLDTDFHTDGVPYSSSVTGSIDPVMRIRQGIGLGSGGRLSDEMPRYTDSGGYTHEGVPVPLDISSKAGVPGLIRGLVTPKYGILARESDFTSRGRDVLENAKLGQIINRSEEKAFDDAWSLAKAYGDPGEMGWWSKTYGGESPGKNDRRVFNFIRDNKDKLNEYLADRRVEWDVDNPVDIPRFESDLPRGKQRRDEMLRILGATGGANPFSFTEKMPGPSLAFPVHTCNVGMRMAGVKDSTCAGCYATQGRYPLNNKQIQAYNNLHALTENDPRYASALTDRIKAEMMYYGEPYFRWFDSGDLQRGRGETQRNMGAQHFAQLIDIARATPEGKFWLPTREVAGVQDVMRRRGPEAIPDNMKVRLSLNFPGQSSDDEINEAFGLPNVLSSVKRLNEMPNIEVSGVSSLDPAMKTCPASALGGSCDDHQCRDCWDFQGPISYNAHLHGGKNKVIPLRSSKGVGLDYDELLRPIPVSTNPDIDIRRFMREQ